MVLFGPDHYVPVLKWKQNERLAIGDISASVKSRLTPLIEIIPIPTDPDTEEPKKTLGEHIKDQLDGIVQKWGTERPFFLDPSEITDEREGKLTGPRILYDEADKLGLKYIPVTGLRRPIPEIAEAVNHSANGLCLRLTEEDLEPDPFLSEGFDIDSEALEDTIWEFVSKHDLSPERIDLIYDLGSIVGVTPKSCYQKFRSFIDQTPDIHSWRTLTALSSSFPETPSDVTGSESQTTVPRHDWAVWKALRSSRKLLSRLPSYGDYGIQHPVLPDIDFRPIPLSASVRYTGDADFFIARGVSRREQKFAIQFPKLAAAIIASGHFKGSGHCKGCENVHQCANKSISAASLSVWRRISTTHHLTLVTEQMNQLAAASDSDEQPA